MSQVGHSLSLPYEIGERGELKFVATPDCAFRERSFMRIFPLLGDSLIRLFPHRRS
jgi:hypothetical protein